MKVCVVGLGSIGLPTAELCAKKGHDVTGIDVNPRVVNAINNGKQPRTDQALEYSFRATSEESALREKEVVLVCVPTESQKGSRTLQVLLQAVEAIARNVSKGTLVVVESTVSPGTMENKVIPCFKNATRQEPEQGILFAHCPERLDMGNPNWNVENLPRVLGANSKQAQERAKAFYTSILSGRIFVVSSLKAAELTKVAENTYREINIAYVNELAKLCEKGGVDIVEVIQGASTKPLGYVPFYPGCGIGGTCIPAATDFILQWSRGEQFPLRLVQVAKKINRGMPKFIIGLLQKEVEEQGLALTDLRIGILGIAYKPGIGDTRLSPTLEVVKLLKKKKIAYKAFDPHVRTSYSAPSISELLQWSNGLILMTAHSEFKDIEMQIPSSVRVIIDGRNFLSKETIGKRGIRYKGIGH